jgi:hypothetical protein
MQKNQMKFNSSFYFFSRFFILYLLLQIGKKSIILFLVLLFKNLFNLQFCSVVFFLFIFLTFL